ncbi:Helix-turn-helix [Mucilaginibacter pineti]|uniref:Helix-turn-helix n=2 Tax=Mucilaginibacter pineti TaxID=1391627 RepID=A0A1G7P4Y2_9SPHI|nr:Helix-turn-helix [Mucilaginibacter pineti]
MWQRIIPHQTRIMTNLPNPSLVKFGKHLKGLRTAKKISRKKMALLCDLTNEEIKNYEAGTVDVDLLSMVRLAAALKVALPVLMDYKDME